MIISLFRNKYTVKSTVKMFLLPTTDLPIAVARCCIQLNVDLASQRTKVANEQILYLYKATFNIRKLYKTKGKQCHLCFPVNI